MNTLVTKKKLVKITNKEIGSKNSRQLVIGYPIHSKRDKNTTGKSTKNRTKNRTKSKD